MSLRKYLKAISELGAVSETALYTPLATHILSGALHYEPRYYAINKAGVKGTPDIRILSGDDNSEWIVCEVKLDDGQIRTESKRNRIWSEQILDRGYIRPETFYVLLCAPLSFYVCGIDGEILDAVHIEKDKLLEITSGREFPATDSSLRELLHRVTFESSLQRPQYEKFRRGELAGGYITISPKTVESLQQSFDFAIRSLKTYCRQSFDRFKQEYRQTSAEIENLNKKLEDVGSDPKSQEKVRNQIRELKRRHRLVIELFESDYPQFKHDQTYAGTEKEEHFEDIFITNTAYIALSRLFFVRICEDLGLTTRKVSHEGPGLWRKFVEQIKTRYQDLLDVAYKDVAHVYCQLFEETIFDWYGHGNGRLNDILERILFRLNAFSFKGLSRDVLGSIYQYFRPKAERKRLGEYYTPEEIVDYILDQTGVARDPQIMTKRILDPACGSFTFGVRALAPLLSAGAQLSAENKLELVRQSLLGYDINPFSVFLSHLSLLFATLDIYMEAKQHNPSYSIPQFNIYNRNSLTFVSQADDLQAAGAEMHIYGEQKVDYVIGNPPFVRNERLPNQDRIVLDQIFASIKGGNTDLSAYFIHSSLKYWLKEDGNLGMVAPLGIANTEVADKLRANFRDLGLDYTLEQIVSLEWMAKECFPDADIIPMLIFAKKQRVQKSHKITVVSGIRTKAEIKKAIGDRRFFAKHASKLPYLKWLRLSPTGDWPVEVKSIDLRLLEKLKGQQSLGSIVKTSYAVKLGASAKITRPYKNDRKDREVPLLKGHHVCAFNIPSAGMSDQDELIDLARIDRASGASIWKDLSFYQENLRSVDESGLGRYDYARRDLVNNCNPSDTLCCFVPEVYVTLVAAVADPLAVCALNSVSVVVPLRYSAPVIAAIINSRIARYYAFLLLRSGILLRRRAHWYPRSLKSLPVPDLNPSQAVRLHLLASTAASLSQGLHLSESDAFLDSISRCEKLTKAGFIGLRWTGDAFSVDRDDVGDATLSDERLHIGPITVEGETATLQLLRLALLALDTDEIPINEIQNVMLPAESKDRSKIVADVFGVISKLDQTKRQMTDICEEIDEIVAAGLTLTPREHERIRQRCKQFPLSVTVERPRYVWSADRKRQSRRIYEPGQRFK
jgi:hypothetical protein